MRHYFKFQFYKYIESERGVLEQQILIGLCWVLFKILRTPRSAWTVIVEEIQKSDFKTVIRRSQWLISHSVFRLEPINDRYFDFSIGLNAEAARDMYSYMELRKFDSQFDKEIALAQFASAVIESQLKPGDILFSNESGIQSYDALFVSHLNSALLMLDETKQLNLSLSQNASDKKTLLHDGACIEKAAGEKKMQEHNRFRDGALDVFFGLLDLLESINTPIFAISGTMLGIIREGDFLAHDYDIDIGVFESNLDIVSFKYAIEQSKDYFIKKCDYPAFRCESEQGGVYSRRRVPTLIKIGHRTGIHTDLFVHIQNDEVCWHGSSLHGWVNTPFTLTPVKFFGRDVLVPNNYDLYLTENYGDWRVPVSEFNCSTGTPNTSVTNSCKTLCYITKLTYDYYHQGMKAQASRIEGKMLKSGQFDAVGSAHLHYIGAQVSDYSNDQKFCV